MKREDLFEAVGDLDEALLDENVSEIPKKAKFRWVLPVAACLVLAAGVIAVPYAMRGGLPVGDTPDSPVSPVSTDVTLPVPTTDLSVLSEDNPFTTMQADKIAGVKVMYTVKGVSLDLTEMQIEQFVQHLSELKIVGKQTELLFGDTVTFEITCKDGTVHTLSPGLYVMENYESLMEFGSTLLGMNETTTFELLPPTEEWLGNVYFGSEFPYFIYGNDDYCVFTEGMDGLFIFDFNKGEITFSANITETFNKAGIAHGMEGWNGVGLSAYRENGEIKLLCTASTGGDGTGTRGFTVDVENGTLTEIPNFDRNNLDFNVYVYNVPADGLPYLFGAAPIPLEDGYICFENSGLNNDILPYQGSHLPMIMIRKVKGDDVKDWIPFKDVVPIIKSGG